MLSAKYVIVDMNKAYTLCLGLERSLVPCQYKPLASVVQKSTTTFFSSLASEGINQSK